MSCTNFFLVVLPVLVLTNVTAQGNVMTVGEPSARLLQLIYEIEEEVKL